MILNIDNLSFRYNREILKNLSFGVEKGEFISLLGVNGAGKSTLLKNINRILKPSQGKIFIEDRDIQYVDRREIAKVLGYVSQNNTAGRTTVFDTILIGRYPHCKNIGESDYEYVSTLIEEMGLTPYAMRNIDTLSGGEFQQVVIARAMAQEPKLLLLDEPTSNLDLKNQVKVLKLAKKYCKIKNIAVIVSIHDINLALKFSNKFLLLKDGEIFAYGDHNTITPENIKKIYDIDVDIIDHQGTKIVHAK